MGPRIGAPAFTYVEPTGSGVTADDTRSLLSWARDVGHEYPVPAGTAVIRQDRPATHVVFLQSGTALLRRIERSGLEVVIGQCGIGVAMGLSSVLQRAPHAVSAVLRSEADVIVVPAAHVSGALATAGIGLALIDQLAGEHLGLIRRYAARTTLSVRDRVILFLREETRYASKSPCAVSAGPADIAGVVGADPSHVYRVLRELRAQRAIDFTRGRIVVRGLTETIPS